MTYHTLKVTLRRCGNHAHEAASVGGILDLMLGEAFEIFLDSINMKMLVLISGLGGVGMLGGHGSIGVAVINKKVRGLRVSFQIESMKALFRRFKFNHTLAGEDPKHSIMVMAVVCDPIFLSKSEERENVCDSVGIKLDTVVAKISLLGGDHSAFVTVDVNWSISRANVCDMLRITK